MKTLSDTNPHFQDKEKARKNNARSTRTSCGVEGIVKHDLPLMEIDHSRSDKVLEEMKQRLQQSSEKSSNS
ncbi:TPA: hypothetical protein JBC15_15495 [Legionella pneumophila subsp. pneumophila]|uniref:hypothetical protein n=1 Tax=Legionella pneumophila TaxID=446 RepID=UPI0007707FEF|nr:hypothetical protein [Legionella pneumophila]HAT9216374.1 hypothetical protein [Legionella pneumophila subsp. pneumophila]CZI17408.1 Uncharacterised protein [Legionella pneumophila]HAT9262451.1 hypothetical protein [Legionella pneumophila subsp. pneumophila]HAT9283867.1 hypothetical protein [Legionella pneumophila subsp. pneumophila]HAT9289925.1 hypothetical protein [Legionella pneumophila subsp. pneumophila]